MLFSQEDDLLALLQAVNTAIFGHTVQRLSGEAVGTQGRIDAITIKIYLL